MAGPPLATALIAAFGSRAILAAIAVVAVLNISTTAGMRGSRAPDANAAPQPPAVLSGRIVAVVVVFIALQATNSATVSIMSLFVTDRMGLDVAWSGVALGVAAGLEIPALLLIGKLSNRVPGTRLLLSGCLAGLAYYTAMAFAAGPSCCLDCRCSTPGSSAPSPASA